MELSNPPVQATGRQHRLEIVYRPIDELKPNPHNPRRHPPKKIKQLAGSIKAFGFWTPALVDGADNVIAGHARILACREMGWTEIPTIPVEGLSEVKRRALMLADNRLAENAKWDDRLLAEQLKELSLAEINFNIEAIGFEMGEIDFRIAELDGKPVGPVGPIGADTSVPLAPQFVAQGCRV